MHVAACQFDIAWEDKPANFQKVRQLVAAAHLPGGALLALPEMFATGFSMNVDRVAEPADGPTHAFLAALAAEWKIYLVAGVATAVPGSLARNEAVVFNPAGEEIARYCKQQPFTLGGERDHYQAGTRTVRFSCGDWDVAPLVCYDLRFPELFRPVGEDVASLLVVIANWPQARAAHWTALLMARAIENQAYVLGVNRTGSDPRLNYQGESCIIDPRGNMLAQAGSEEIILTANLDLKDLLDYRRKFPALADRAR